MKMENLWLKERCEELGLDYENLNWAELMDAEFKALDYLRKGQLVPEELKREILDSKATHTKDSHVLNEKDVAVQCFVAEEVFNKLVEANIVNKNAEAFQVIHNDVIKKLKFLPAENLKKLLSAFYKPNSTLSEWFQEMKKQGFFDFMPYLYKERDVIFFVLAYDKYMTWSKEKKFQLVSTDHVISTDRDSMNDKVYHLMERMLEKISKEDDDSTKLLQLLFYMSITNTGVISKVFRNMLSKTNGLLDKFAKLSGEAHLFYNFNFKFFDFVPYLERYRVEDTFRYSDIKKGNWIWFRVPADNLNYDFCRIGIGSSLKTIMEYRHKDTGNHELIRVDFESAFNKLYCLSTEEKEKILSDSDIGRAVVTFTLSLHNINITKTDVYSTAPTETKLLSKSLENLPILYDSTELDYCVFEKLWNRQSGEQERPMNVVTSGFGVSPMPMSPRPMPVPPRPTPAGLGMPPMQTPPVNHSPAGLGMSSIPMPPVNSRPADFCGMSPIQYRQ